MREIYKETTYQVSSELPEFHRRYYKKNILNSLILRHSEVN